MCEYCREWHGEDTICGCDIEVENAIDAVETQIMKNTEDKKAGIAIFMNKKHIGYFDIEYCPFCGRKL